MKKSASGNEEADILRHLASINRDACDFYLQAAGRIQDAYLERTFKNLEVIHEKVAGDLLEKIGSRDSGRVVDGTVSGKLDQFFTGLFASVSSDMDKTFVVNLEEAETRCLHDMQDAVARK